MATRSRPPFPIGRESKREEAMEKKLPPKQYAALERKEMKANPKVHTKKK